MVLSNSISVKIIAKDFDTVSKKPALLKKLRALTLHGASGLNYELDQLLEHVKTRSVNAKVILAYHKQKLVGWALLSREKSDFYFQRAYNGYNSTMGTLFEVYVDPDYRRQGIGGAIMKAARQKAGSMKLCVCPWDYQSTRFYQSFDHYKTVKM